VSDNSQISALLSTYST